jgi:predicted ATPase
MLITNLAVRNFRSLRDVTFPLHSLNVVIGPNGSGKTALMEVVQLLRSGILGELNAFFDERGGYSSVVSQNGTSAHSAKLAIEVQISEPALFAVSTSRPTLSQSMAHIYMLELVGRSIGYSVSSEYLRSISGVNGEHEIYDFSSHAIRNAAPQTLLSRLGITEYRQDETILAQIPAPASGRLEVIPKLKKLLANVRLYRPLDVAERSQVRLPQALTPAQTPGTEGEALFSALYNLRISEPDTYERLMEIMRQAFPGLQRLEFPVVGAGLVTLAWYDTDFSQPFYPNQLSEGTLRFLWLTSVLLTAPTNSLLLIDEPELSLHPELLRTLAILLQEASLETQILVATHSSDFINWLKPDEVLIANKEAGQTRFTWADTMNLEEWLKEYTLRDLWAMGNLGGRP